VIVVAAVLLAVAIAYVLVAQRSASVEGGWLSSDSSGAMFVQMTEVDGRLAGSVQIWRPDGGFGSPSGTESVSLSGLRSESSVSITLEAALGARLTWTGEVAGDELTLQITSNDGRLRSAVFRRASVEDFNGAVSRGEVDQQERDVAAQQRDELLAAEQELAEAVDQAEKADQRVAEDVDELARLIEDLGAIDLQPEIDAMEADLQAMRDQLDRVIASPECVAQADGLVRLGDLRIGLADSGLAYRDAAAEADGRIGRAAVAVDELATHKAELDAAIERAGSAAPTTTITNDDVAEQLDGARAAIEAARARLDQTDDAAGGFSSTGDSLLDEGEGSIESCAASAPERAPSAPGAPPLPPTAPAE